MPYVPQAKREVIDALLADGQKHCCQCGQTKPITEFSRRKLDKTGFCSECKACHKRSWSQKYQQKNLQRHQEERLERSRLREQERLQRLQQPVRGILSPEYIAGFFDGEGWIIIAHASAVRWRGVNLRVGIGHTNFEILACLKAMFGGSLLGGKSKRKKWKPKWELTWTGQIAERFLLCIRPFVILKKSQVELALAFIDYKRLPKDQRYDVSVISAHWRNGVPGHIPHWQRKPEVVEREFEFRDQMMVLNKKGA